MKHKQEKIILGLDPGFGRTGFAVLGGTKNEPRLISFGCLETSAKLLHPQRLEQLAKQLKKLLTRYQPQLISIEKIFFAANSKTALQVGEARGVLLVTIAVKHLPIVEFTPPQVKLAVTGDGRADKKQIQKMLQLVFKLTTPIKQDDAADAVAIAFCALTYL
ncbi:MAG: crossover junction endodeoxyribonuclease RuvC [Patescibacteria group bacterium]